MLLLLCLLHATAGPMGPPDAASMKATWAAHETGPISQTVAFTDAEWEKLARGQVVKRRDREDGVDRAVGAMWTAAAQDHLWLAMQDEEHWNSVAGYAEEDLPGSIFVDRQLYQRIGLPWPFADRQWVINVRSNLELLAWSEGAVWERHWVLSDRKDVTIADENAVWVPINQGAWVLAAMPHGNLLIYHVRADPGGSFPENAGTQWALWTIGGMLNDMAQRATEEMPNHYVEGHTGIERMDGTLIGFFGR